MNFVPPASNTPGVSLGSTTRTPIKTTRRATTVIVKHVIAIPYPFQKLNIRL